MDLKPWQRKHKRNEIESLDALRAFLGEHEDQDLAEYVVQGVDLSDGDPLAGAKLEGALFVGCRFRDRAQEIALIERGAAIFPPLNGQPYDAYRSALYSVEELLEGYDEGGYTATRDFSIYAHFDRERHHPGGTTLRETLAQRLHDQGIDDALYELLEEKSGRGVVAMMGGHGAKRSAREYRQTALVAWELTRRGYFVASGGGPGVMEAANLGAYFSNYANPEIVDAAIALLARSDKFDGGEEEGTPAYLAAIKEYFQVAHEVLDELAGDVSTEIARSYQRERDEPGESLAIPTWFYGHEPTNLFCTHVAKYFSNSLREDGLLAIATAGVVYAPGSAGTMQEIFMDLAQNHYATFAYRSPMVFLGIDRYAELFRLVTGFVQERSMQDVYGDLLHLADEPREVVQFIEDHPPRLKETKTPLYELND